MSNDSCPFTLGSRPAVLAGRSAELGALTERLKAILEGQPSSAVLLVGQIGNGRTTLVREFARAASDLGWSPAIVAMTAQDDVGRQLARGLATAALHARQQGQDSASARALVRTAHSFGLAYGIDLPLGVDADSPAPAWSGDLADDVAKAFELASTHCRQMGTGLLLIFDDAPLSQRADLAIVAGAAAEAAQDGFPIMVVFTGLISLKRVMVAHGLLDSGIDVIVVGPLGPDDIAAAVAEPARRSGRPFTIDGLESFVRRCRGLPTFAQMLARHSWLASEGPITERDVAVGAGIVERQLVTAVYEPMHRVLSPAHRRLLHALMEEGGTASFDVIRRRLGDTNRFDPNASGLVALRDDLFNREVLASIDGDILEFALAGYDRYIQKVP